MDIFTAVGACLRRWYAFVPLVGLVAVLVVGDIRSAEPVYSALGRVIILPPQSVAGETVFPGQSINVYAAGGGRDLVAEVAAANLTSDALSDRLEEAGATADYAVSTGDIGGTLEVEAGGTDEVGVARTVEVVVEAAVEMVQQVQTDAGAPANQLFTAQRLAPDSEPLGETPSVIRSAATIAVVGLAMSVLLVVLLDALILRRRRSVAGGEGAVMRHDVAAADPPHHTGADDARAPEQALR